MTRKMEHLFLTSQDHVPIESALRTAELIALGAGAQMVKAVMSTDLSRDLRQDEFWRTVFLFLIANADDIDPTQIAPMIDYIQAVRRNQIMAETQETGVGFHAPETVFSMKGRTVKSMLRLMQDWHRSLGAGSANFSWMPSPFMPFSLEEQNSEDPGLHRFWQITELTNSAQLRSEGTALHHCVASYADRCCRGISSIWSLRLWQGEKLHHVLTVEIDPKNRAVVQARGRANRIPSGKSLRILHDWAIRERLRMGI